MKHALRNTKPKALIAAGLFEGRTNYLLIPVQVIKSH